MRLNSKVTWGLAWTGLAVVLAVPSADFLTGRLGGNGDAAAVLTSDVDPVKTASTVTTVKTENGIRIVPAGGKAPAATPVNKAAGTGKALPDYISGGDSPAETETQIASIDPNPPTPFPYLVRPRVAEVATAPVLTSPAAPAAPVLAAPAAPALTLPAAPALATPAAPVVTAPAVTPEPVVIVDETLTGSIAEPAAPLPPSPIVDDSANWDEETLRDYLERRGILGGGTERSTATVTERSTTYDADGFYMNDGPVDDRVSRETRRQRLDRLFEESGDDPESFTLF
jgi:hypothetical protein